MTRSDLKAAKAMKPKPRNVRVLLLNVGQPDRWGTVDPNNANIKRLLPLLDSAFPPDDNLIFYSTAQEDGFPALPYNCLVRGKPAYGPIMIMKRDGAQLVNMERADIPRAYSYIMGRHANHDSA